MKKSGRRLLGLLLAASMAMTAAVPTQGAEAEGSNMEYEETEQKKSESELEENPGMLLQNGLEEDTVTPRDDSYDINCPVIENFELEENGQTLDETATVHFNLWMYDADSDIQVVSVELYSSNTGIRNLVFEKSGQGNLYTSSISCGQLSEGRHCITRIYAEDAKGNYTNFNVYEEDGQERYWFIKETKKIEGTVTLSGLKMKKNMQEEGETLKAGDSVTYTADVHCENEKITDVQMNIIYKEKSRDLNINSVYQEEEGIISGEYRVAEQTYPGEWELNYIWIRTSSGKRMFFEPKEIGSEEELAFTVEQDYDETKPVIESIDIGENGRTVQAGETVEIKVKVEEEHPAEVGAARFSLQESNRTDTRDVTLRYHADTKEYTGEIEIIESTYPGRWELTSLWVKDTYENYADLEDYEMEHQNASRYYIVSPDAYDAEGPVIKGIWLDKNGQTVEAGSRVSIEVEVEEQNPAPYADIRFVSKELDYYYASISVSLQYNESAHKYAGTIDITKTTEPGRWELAELTLRDENFNYTSLSECEEILAEGPWYFIVDPQGYDSESPVIERLTIDKNGQWVSPGETVNISIKVTEKNPSPSAVAYFHPQVTNVSVSERVDLTYNSETQEYTGSISITEDTYPCEWALTSLELKDSVGYWAYLTDFQPGWEYTRPWYYKVKSKNTYREDFKNVTFRFYGYAQMEDGSYQPNSLISSETVEHVGRRATLNELGIFPKPIDGVDTVWNYEWHNWEVDGDMELLFESSGDMTCNFYARYDKGCANVNLTYLSEEKGIQEIMLPVFADRETTYQEITDLLELPADAKTEDFAGFQLQDGCDGSAVVGEMAYLSVKAVYNSCQVAWNTRYLDQRGREITKVIAKSYPEGTRVSDALAQLEEPEETEGMNWKGWILTAADTEETLSQPMTAIDAAAVYHGKTTAEVSYSYRGKDGKACGSKWMLMEGEDLSDAEIQGAATNAFKEAEHLNGLKLSEWTGTIQLDLGNYKKISFEAQYHNCVVQLKYPDGTCQYVVVDKGSSYTLPDENEKYEDILWEGFSKGETIVVTEDREILAANARLKETQVEQPKGEKLSEDEIAKIIEEVEKADAGAVIQIDMKKATVVPKEILEAIQGKPVDIVLNLDGYGWSIGGDEVFASELMDIDLEVKIGADAVPSQLVASIAGGKPTTQLSLTHNGNFGFRADLILNLGSMNSGGVGNLYYYDSDGKLKFMNAGQIGEDGTTSLSFSHASDYVVVIDNLQQEDKKEEDSEDNSQTSGSGTDGSQNDGSQANDQTSKTVPDSEKEKNSGNNHAGRETISIRKNETSLTGDSAKTETGGKDSGERKSPKTGDK